MTLRPVSTFDDDDEPLWMDDDGPFPDRAGCVGLLVAIVVSWVVAGLAVVGAVTVLRRLLGRA